MSPDMPRRADGAAWRMVDGEMIVVSATNANIISLNGTGAFVWERLDGTNTLKKIAQEMCDAYAIQSDEAVCHVSEFVDTLEAEGLVETSLAVSTP